MPWTDFLKKLNTNANKKHIQRQFVGILVLVTVSIAGIALWKGQIPLDRFWIILAISLALGGGLYWKPKTLKPLLFIWLLLGMLLGEITSTIILGIVYYLLFFPITFIIRKRKGKPVSQSSWRLRKQNDIDYKKLF